MVMYVSKQSDRCTDNDIDISKSVSMGKHFVVMCENRWYFESQ